jgi:hypothetical protein
MGQNPGIGKLWAELAQKLTEIFWLGCSNGWETPSSGQYEGKKNFQRKFMEKIRLSGWT